MDSTFTAHFAQNGNVILKKFVGSDNIEIQKIEIPQDVWFLIHQIEQDKKDLGLSYFQDSVCLVGRNPEARRPYRANKLKEATQYLSRRRF